MAIAHCTSGRRGQKLNAHYVPMLQDKLLMPDKEDLDLVLLSPSVRGDLVSLSGSDERVRDLDPTGVEGKCILSSPAESPNSPTNVDSITELMVGLCLHANEAQASRGAQPHGFDYSRLERQLDAILGPHPSKEDLHSLYFVFTSALAQLSGATIDSS
jgi:hypothetical protein